MHPEDDEIYGQLLFGAHETGPRWRKMFLGRVSDKILEKWDFNGVGSNRKGWRVSTWPTGIIPNAARLSVGSEIMTVGAI